MEDIRQFQTKEERANDELRRLLGDGPVKITILPGFDEFVKSYRPKLTREPEEIEVGRVPCRQPNLPIIPRIKFIPGSGPGYKTYSGPNE